jgi:hypothetical protein
MYAGRKLFDFLRTKAYLVFLEHIVEHFFAGFWVREVEEHASVFV